ncbi:FRG domain-containing protein [Streptomyces sp. NPDC001153]
MSHREVCTHFVFSSWEDVLASLDKAGPRWIFRGQRDYSWPILTKLGRTLRMIDSEHKKDWIEAENSAIGYFMDRASALLRSTPDEHDLLAWLALMQHYGAPTRLLDWSFSPYVALYFAYEQPNDSDSALFALDSVNTRHANTGRIMSHPWDHLGIEKLDSKDNQEMPVYPHRNTYQNDFENEVLRTAIEKKSKCPIPTIPFQQDDRMSAQQTVFTLMGDIDVELDIWFTKEKWELPENWFREMFDRTLGAPAGPYLIKMRLRPEWRDRALKALEAMGISTGTLFPGLDGIGRATTGHLLSGRLSPRDILMGMN